MIKSRLNDKDLFQMIRKCYESDKDHILKVHVVGNLGLDACIDRTVFDLVNHSVDIYTLEDKEEFIGYFGEGIDKTLTGFFISPEKRKLCKKEFWNVVTNHFNKDFKIGIYAKNIPAINFLMNNGCKMIDLIHSPDGEGMIFEYRESI